ncbi:MAG: MMPL family transporter [Conexibacter sp.]
MTKLARLIVGRPRLVVAVWAVGVVGALVPASQLQHRVRNDGYGVPGSQSHAVSRLIAANFDNGDREVLYAVIRGRGTTARAWQIATHIRDQRALAVVRLFAPQTARGLAALPFTLPGTLGEVQQRMPTLQRAIRRVDPGAQLLGRAAVLHESTQISQQDLSRAEAIALPLTLVILIVAFLSIVAAGVPITLAVALMGVTFGALSLLALHINLSVFVTNTASILGLGLAIDYSLFMVTRYRELRSELGNDEAAICRTLETTGYAILFSGITIALALSSLAVLDLGVFTSMALGASLAAGVAALGALTLLPALLLLVGFRIDRLSVRSATRAATSGRLWRWIARVTLRRPLTIVLSVSALLALCSLPLLTAHLTFGGTDVALPPRNGLRSLNDATQDALGPGLLNPIEIVTNTTPRQVIRQLRRSPGVASVSAALPGDHGWNAIIALPTMPANTPAADHLVQQLRSRLIVPRGSQLFVGGETAEGVDLLDRLKARSLWMVAAACTLSFLLLAIAFRSLVLPLKAVLTNLISVAATLGLVSLLFEGLGSADGIAWFVPPLLFTIVFGLSMDYEIFLLSRVREEHLATASDDDAITQALVHNGRAITLAAAVMVTIFLALATGRLAAFQQLGVGMAIAVFLDATLVRCALVPAAVKLLGDRNWWLPRTLDNLLPASRQPEVAVGELSHSDG